MMMMMKNPVILVTCLMSLSFLAVLASENSFGPDKCCFRYISYRLPLKKVQSFKYTDTLCSMEGVLFTMRKGAEICADPTMPWVKRIIEAKLTGQKDKVNNSTTPTPQ
ncbi:chemokine (C-C motif) ligand 38, duplicate 4 [Cololabis saira]|uniref:chemokine (C-C motif) ligand 38, duplicate 4 n=1 Tax=Cololabis saira TaxID=129043 RepID=UPI002AD48478|nr:chemokine (C-C motif) ligand 38, duplicate 4 [Cololabis saira]